MGALVLKHNWTRQPPIAQIDRDNPLSRGVVAFFTGGSLRDVVSGLPFTFAGSGRREGSEKGLAFCGSNTAATGSFSLNLSGRTGFTFSGLVFFPSVIDNDDLLFEHSPNINSNASSFHFLAKSGVTTNCAVTYRSTAAVYNSKTFPIPAAGWHYVTFSADMLATAATVFKVWIDGAPITLSDTASNTGTFAALSNYTLFLNSRNNASLFFNGRHAASAWFGRAITSDSEARALASNPWQLLRPVQRRLWVVGETSVEPDALTALDLVVGSPVLGAPALGQIHAMAASGLTVSSPVLGVPALGQIHGLTAQDLVVGSPALGTPALTENLENVDNLTAQDLVVGAPVLGSPTLGQTHALSAADLVVGSPVLGAPTLSDGTVQPVPQTSRGGTGRKVYLQTDRRQEEDDLILQVINKFLEVV